MPLIPIALALAQYAPSLMRFLKVGEESTSIVEKAISIAQDVTGTHLPEEALERMRKDTQLQAEFNLSVLNANTTLEKAYLADVNSARVRDMSFQQNGIRNYRADTMYVLAVAVVLGLVYAVFKSELDEYAKGIITLVLGRFLGYLDNIYNFEYGTTRSNRTKDETISKLSNRE